MSFVAKLQRAREVLEQQGRLSVRALGRELELRGTELDELIDELVDVQGVAVRDGSVLACAAPVERRQPVPGTVEGSRVRNEEEAEDVTSGVLDRSRERRVGLEFESLNLATLSRAALGRGDAARARQLAEEAIALGKERGQKVLVQQYVALAYALCAEHGQRARGAVEDALQAAAAAVAETGARGLEPLIAEIRAELARVCGDAVARGHHLREAHRLYEAIGATGHAARLAKALQV
ncbi:MAG: hypothetical protein HY699_23215 [Deltaproteobacteria bacterium]|nr:hypothetical protein [Deltaproteobacteria bacterium]